MIADFAGFGVSVLLFSGGEPLMREDVFELGLHASEKGLRPVLSTNGTLINESNAVRLKESGFKYVGVSLDGLETTNDLFRGMRGAFRHALDGIRACLETGLKVGIRFTITKRNAEDLGGMLDLLAAEGVPRLCVYHLVYAGRGSDLMKEDLDKSEARAAMDLIFARTEEMAAGNAPLEILTVDNPADGVYLYLQMRKQDKRRADEVLRLLRLNGGSGSGVSIGCVDNVGNVHPDQFWRHYSFGNVRKRPFSELWNGSDPIQAGLRNKEKMVKGRCRGCHYLDICKGGLRVRAEAVSGDVWAEEPACYLTDEEIYS
jgi:radical SAM protein with 4Fe4S-binding SPASM domain